MAAAPYSIVGGAEGGHILYNGKEYSLKDIGPIHEMRVRKSDGSLIVNGRALGTTEIPEDKKTTTIMNITMTIHIHNTTVEQLILEGDGNVRVMDGSTIMRVEMKGKEAQFTGKDIAGNVVVHSGFVDCRNVAGSVIAPSENVTVDASKK